MGMYKRYIKRILDVIFSLIGIIIALPFFVIISFLVIVIIGKPIFFKQERVSKGGKVFYMVKFRTMLEEKDENGILLPNDKRLTKLGIILRSSSLDELPELINIFKGDMSFIGPRPLIPDYMPYYTKEELTRFIVKGGLIPPEILYKNITPTWEEQFRYEIDYGNKVNFILDLKILLATAKGMLMRHSIGYGSYDRPSLILERTKQEVIKVEEDVSLEEVVKVEEDVSLEEIVKVEEDVSVEEVVKVKEDVSVQEVIKVEVDINLQENMKMQEDFN